MATSGQERESIMYNALNDQFMFLDMQERTDRMRAVPRGEPKVRRWRRAA